MINFRNLWPFVKRSTHNKLLDEYQRHEEHYWKQAAHNGAWEKKYNNAQVEIKALTEKLNEKEAS